MNTTGVEQQRADSVEFWEPDLLQYKKESLPEVFALKSIRGACKTNANAHRLKAEKLKALNVILNALLGICTTTSAFISTVKLDQQPQPDFPIPVLLVLNVTSATITVLLNILVPGERRSRHLSSEHQYKCLGRDISVKFATNDELTENEFWSNFLKDCQRILDNIQGAEPTVQP